ncbi:MAG: extracellular solute-binding protein [Candidatus Onthomonas sp.]
MKRKNWLAGLLALLMVLGLAGCGGGENFSTEKLTVWIWDENQKELWESLAQPWSEEKHIEVEFTVKNRDTYWSELERGPQPDLFWVDSSHVQQYIANGTLRSLDEYLEENRAIRLKDYNNALLGTFQSGGKTYALPKDSSVTALWYNKSIFDSMGLAYPDETWTWETLYINAQKLTNRHNGSFGLAISENDTADGWYNLVYAYGGFLVETDENGNRISGWGEETTGQAMELLARLIRDCMPSQPTMAQQGVEQLFAGGHVAMVLQSSAEALELIEAPGASNWACTLLPYCDRDGSGDCGEGERLSLIQGTGWAISAKSVDGAAAYSLLTTLCGEEGQKAQSAANLAQPAMNGLGEDWGASIPDWDFSPYRDTLAQGTLIAAPAQLAGENWEDYAISNTMYVAWNNPDRMNAQLSRQQEYTATDLASAQPAEPEQIADENIPEGGTDQNQQDAPEEADGEEAQG